MSPSNAWLAIRGLRTLPVRMKTHQETVIKILDELKQDKRIEKIYIPISSKKH